MLRTLLSPVVGALVLASPSQAAAAAFQFVQPRAEICLEGTAAIRVGVRQIAASRSRVVFVSIYDKRNLVFHRMVVGSSRWWTSSYDPPALPIYGAFGEAAYPAGNYRVVYRVGKKQTVYRTNVVFCGG